MTSWRRHARWLVTRGLALFVVGAVGPAAGWQVTSNLVYATAATRAHSGGGTTHLLLDVYAPDEPSGRERPTLVLVHGGSFVAGDKTSPEIVDAACYFAERGWVCAAINYRLTADDPPVPWWVELYGDPQLSAAYAAVVDTKRAMRWVRTHAGEWQVDPRRLAVLGHSAGAFCAVLAAITDEDDFANDAGTGVPDLYPEQSGKPNAAVEVSGGDAMFDAEYDAADPPLMIWHGDADTVVPYTNALAVAAQCAAHGIPYRFCTLAGKQHGAETWLATVDGRNIKERTEDFLDRFFKLRVALACATDGPVLSWPGLTNARYQVLSAPTLDVAFTNLLLVQATSETVRVSLSGTNRPAAFLRVRILSGQW